LHRRRDLFVLLFFLLIFFLFIYLLFGLTSPQDGIGDLKLAAGEKVGLLRIVGPIYDAKPILEELDRVEDSPAIKALVVRLETPGGAVAASQEIYRKLASLRDEVGVPIVASMGNVAASGGYYVALGADTIIANPGTITGSIGVLMVLPEYYELFSKIGIGYNVIKSGKFKDAGSPYRRMTADERDYLQSFIDDGYRQFVETVSRERGLPVEAVELLADGRVFTGRQALELGLVDQIGGLDQAVTLAGTLGDISGKPEVVELSKRKKLTLLDLLFGDLNNFIYLKLGLGCPLRYQMPHSIP
jgi:protease-4